MWLNFLRSINYFFAQILRFLFSSVNVNDNAVRQIPNFCWLDNEAMINCGLCIDLVIYCGVVLTTNLDIIVKPQIYLMHG
jgi:hypothetical protein